jgi:hypothetical protein
MMKRGQWQLAVVGAVGVMVACTAEERTVEPRLSAGSASSDKASAGSGGFQFTPLTSSACARTEATRLSQASARGLQQTVIASEGAGVMDDSPDMNTQNENGRSRDAICIA